MRDFKNVLHDSSLVPIEEIRIRPEQSAVRWLNTFVQYSNNVQRNMDLVRSILLAIESTSSDGQLLDLVIPTFTPEEISYHVMLLHKAGLVEAEDFSNLGGRCWKPRRLTWDGHEFIDAFKSDTVWNKTKSFVMEKTGTLSVEALKLAGPIVLKMMLGA